MIAAARRHRAQVVMAQRAQPSSQEAPSQQAPQDDLGLVQAVVGRQERRLVDLPRAAQVATDEQAKDDAKQQPLRSQQHAVKHATPDENAGQQRIRKDLHRAVVQRRADVALVVDVNEGTRPGLVERTGQAHARQYRAAAALGRSAASGRGAKAASTRPRLRHPEGDVAPARCSGLGPARCGSTAVRRRRLAGTAARAELPPHPSALQTSTAAASSETSGLASREPAFAASGDMSAEASRADFTTALT